MFKSCKWIHSGIVFNQNELGHCCYAAPGGGRPTITNDKSYNGEILNYDSIFEKKEKIKALQQKGETYPPCEGCEFLEVRDWDNSRKIKNIVIQQSPVCNCKCTYCFTEQNKEYYNTWKPYSVLPAVKDMISNGILERGAYINIAGGEPTILVEFEEICDLLLAHDCFLDVFSSGIKFSPKVCENMHTGRVNVTTSLDSGCAETYKVIKQLDAFDKTVSNLTKYAENQYSDMNRLRTKYIILPGVNDNIEEVSKWLHLNSRMGVREVMLDIEEVWFKNNRNNIPENYFEIIRFVETVAKELNLTYYPCLNVIQALKN